MTSAPRVVVTGMGAVTAYGRGLLCLWDGILSGVNTIKPITRFATKGLPSRIASEVDATALTLDIDPPEGRAAAMAHAAAHDALNAAGIDQQSELVNMGWAAAIGWEPPPLRFLETVGLANEAFATWSLSAEGQGAVVGHAEKILTQSLGCGGPGVSDHAACAAGLHAVVHGARAIRSRRVPWCLVGASDSRCHPLGILGYARLGALTTSHNDSPEKASRPFDRDRDGFVIGEGAGFLVLESLEHAVARGARIWAELTGWALASDAGSPTDPLADGSRAVTCIRQCLDRAGVTQASVDHINAHGTSTPANDRMECLAYRCIFGDTTPPVSSAKALIGHLGMAAAAVESIVAIGSLIRHSAPPNPNLQSPDTAAEGVDLVGPQPRKLTNPRRILKTAYGFGGQNAAVLWERFSDSPGTQASAGTHLSFQPGGDSSTDGIVR